MVDRVHYTFIEEIFNRIEEKYTLEEFFRGLLEFGPKHSIGSKRAKLASSAANCLDAALQVVETAAANLREPVQAKLKARLPNVLQRISGTVWFQDWSFKYVKQSLKKEVLHLVEPTTGLYGNAANAKADDVLNFNMDSMVEKLRDHAPKCWEIVRSLVNATDSKRRLKNQRGRANKEEREKAKKAEQRAAALKSKDEETGSDSEPDFDDPYDLDDDLDDGPMVLIPNEKSVGKRRRRIQDTVEAYSDICDLKAATMLFIAVNSSSQRANKFQVALGIHMLACGASDSTVHVMHHAGVITSLTSSYNARDSIIKGKQEELVELCKTNSTAWLYDNVNFAVTDSKPTLFEPPVMHNITAGTMLPLSLGESSTDALKITKSLFDSSPLNPLRTAEAADAYITPTFNNLLEATTKQGLRPHEAVKKDLISQIIRMAVETIDGLDRHKDALRELREREDVFKLDLHKTVLHPVTAMDEDEGTLSSNDAVLQDMRRQGGYTAEQAEFVTVTHVDLATLYSIESLQRSRRNEGTSLESRHAYCVPIPGAFHLLMAMGHAFAKIHIADDPLRTSGSFFSLAAMSRPRMASKFLNDTPFRLMQHAIMMSSTASLMDCLQNEIPNGDLTHFAATVTWDELVALCTLIHDKYVANRDISNDDPVLFNQCQMHQNGLLYIATQQAIRTGDVGRIENLLFLWIPIFKAAKRYKYAETMLEFLVNLRCNWPREFADIVRRNWLVNITGRPDEWMGVDMAQEINNKKHKKTGGGGSNRSLNTLIKNSPIISFLSDVSNVFDRNFKSNSRSTSHTSKSPKALLNAMQGHIAKLGLNRDSGTVRRSEHVAVMNAHEEGLEQLLRVGNVKVLHGLKEGAKVVLPTVSTDSPSVKMEMD